MSSSYDAYELGMDRPYDLQRVNQPIPANDNSCPICLREYGVAEEDQGAACVALQPTCGHFIGSECFVRMLHNGNPMRCALCRAPFPRTAKPITKALFRVLRQAPFRQLTWLGARLSSAVVVGDHWSRWAAIRYSNFRRGALDEQLANGLFVDAIGLWIMLLLIWLVPSALGSYREYPEGQILWYLSGYNVAEKHWSYTFALSTSVTLLYLWAGQYVRNNTVVAGKLKVYCPLLCGVVAIPIGAGALNLLIEHTEFSIIIRTSTCALLLTYTALVVALGVCIGKQI